MVRAKSKSGNVGRQKMATLFNSLADLGYSKKFIRQNALPTWWDEDVASDQLGFQETQMRLAFCLGLDPASLENGSPQFTASRFRFRFKGGTADDPSFQLVRSFATQIGKLSILATKCEYKSVPVSASSIRDELLRNTSWVGLEELLDFSWSHGIPVLRLQTLPGKSGFPIRKPHSMVVSFQQRQAIILFRNHKSPAWHLFDVAHELGHIALGHMDSIEALLDEDIDPSVSRVDEDSDEMATNQFASELLTGVAHKSYSLKQLLNSVDLARLANQVGKKNRTDPGHILLNLAKEKSLWPLASAALGKVESPDAFTVLGASMRDGLDFCRLPDEQGQLLKFALFGKADFEENGG